MSCVQQSTFPPHPPHGTPPNEDNPLGEVAEQDKSLSLKMGESWDTVKEVLVEAKSAVAEILGISSHSTQSQHGVVRIPEGPHGVPPTDFNCQRFVAQEDKTYPQVAGEKLEKVKDTTQQKLDETKQTVSEYTTTAAGTINQKVENASQKVVEGYQNLKESTNETLNQAIGLPHANTRPGVVPEGPHGVPPTDFNCQGFVAQEDKTYAQVVGEKLEHVKEDIQNLKESTNEKFNKVVGLPHPTEPRVVPEGPHGIPPSDFSSKGFVAQEDKTYPQVAGEKFEQVKETAHQKLDELKVATAETVEQVKMKAAEKLEEVREDLDKKLQNLSDSISIDMSNDATI